MRRWRRHGLQAGGLPRKNVRVPAGSETALAGIPVRPPYGADSVREIRPVPVGHVGQGVGLAMRKDESTRMVNGLQDIATPTPPPYAYRKLLIYITFCDVSAIMSLNFPQECTAWEPFGLQPRCCSPELFGVVV